MIPSGGSNFPHLGGSGGIGRGSVMEWEDGVRRNGSRLVVFVFFGPVE